MKQSTFKSTNQLSKTNNTLSEINNPFFKIKNLAKYSNNKIFTTLCAILFLSFFTTVICPENISASVKKTKSSTKSITMKSAAKTKTIKITSKNNKNESSNKNESLSDKNESPVHTNKSSEMLAYFAKFTGKQIKNYTQYSSVVKNNETIVQILKPYGMTHADIFEFAKTNKKTFSLRQIKVGKAYSVISENDSIKKARYLIYEKDTKKYIVLPINDYSHVNEIDSTKICDSKSDKKSARTTTISDKTISDNKSDNDIRIKQVSGIIKSSLHKTAAHMGLNKKMTNHLTSIFKNTSALSNLHKGDLIQVAYQEKYVKGKRVKTGVITAAIITSRNKSYHAYRFTYNGKHGYYDENGNSLNSSFLKAPLKYKEISSGFSARRFHPIKHIYQPHPGIDYAAPKGTPIKSVGDGVVIFKGYADSAGNYMKIRHPGVGISEYMHMSGFHSSIKVNKKVSRGDIIGYVGTTGYATGPHLDLRFMVNKQYVDYRKLKLPHGNPLPKKFRNIFLQQVALLNKQWNRTARRELSMNTINPLMNTANPLINKANPFIKPDMLSFMEHSQS
ncbi:MAG: peptidoglycan DD-metalloendopeptidase family protein [Desulfamplus sp.]|nr:peptidoglycan DD-metalloendopeptidase family protein [Desulfamplus sp.]